MLVKLLVNDKDWETQDGYDLICTEQEIGLAVQIAVKNGFKDIRISEPLPEEKYMYFKELNREDEI